VKRPHIYHPPYSEQKGNESQCLMAAAIGAATIWPRYRSALACGVLEGAAVQGERTMATRILNELLLFSGLAAFVTGVVLAAARLLI
jgi:hypothetical protein